MLAVIGLAIPSAYVIETTGPAIDVAGKCQGEQLVTLSDARTHTSLTKLFMMTVSSYGIADNGVPSTQVSTSLFAPDTQAVPVWALCSENETSSGVDRKNAAFMTDSQDNAVVAALGKMGHTVAMELVMAGVSKSFRMSGKLAKEDVFTSTSAAGQGTGIRTYSDLVQRLVKTAPGTTVMVGFARNGKKETAEVVTVTREAGATGWAHPGSKLGVYLLSKNLEYPVKVNYGVEQIEGPSAGLMFNLAIYDDPTPGSLGGDKMTAGTRTMSMGGNVGPIGGIQHKLVGASQKGARHFLMPAENCAETVGYEPKGMKVYSVRAFDETVKVVQAIDVGKTSDLQTCRDVVAKSPRE